MIGSRFAGPVAGALLPLLAACTPAASARAPHSPSDSAFAAVQARGTVAMGVDQYVSTHRFDSLPDGGRIEWQLNGDDAADVARIRQHLREIAAAFARGDFSTPAFIHAREVPGVDVMRARRASITYRFAELPRGGEVRLITGDPEARSAIHRFMAFQRSDHRAGGHGH